MLGSHEVFQRKPAPGRLPRSAQHQITSFLLYVGAGSSKLRAAIEGAIGEGSIYNYVWNTVIALLSLKEKVVYMPQGVEREQVAEGFGFPGAVEAIDGTTFTLRHTPHGKHRMDFYNGHHKAYCVCFSFFTISASC